MAYYKDSTSLVKYDGAMFDAIHLPDQPATFAGIYRCEGCGKEIAHSAGLALPAPNDHPHAVEQGEIRWRLTVWAAQ
jgi:hypothetical protein